MSPPGRIINVLQDHKSAITKMAFCPDGRLVWTLWFGTLVVLRPDLIDFITSTLLFFSDFIAFLLLLLLLLLRYSKLIDLFSRFWCHAAWFLHPRRRTARWSCGTWWTMGISSRPCRGIARWSIVWRGRRMDAVWRRSVSGNRCEKIKTEELRGKNVEGNFF